MNFSTFTIDICNLDDKFDPPIFLQCFFHKQNVNCWKHVRHLLRHMFNKFSIFCNTCIDLIVINFKCICESFICIRFLFFARVKFPFSFAVFSVMSRSCFFLSHAQHYARTCAIKSSLLPI